MKGYTTKPPESFAMQMARVVRRQATLAEGSTVMDLALRAEREATLKDVATWLRRQTVRGVVLYDLADIVKQGDIWSKIVMSDRHQVLQEVRAGDGKQEDEL